MSDDTGGFRPPQMSNEQRDAIPGPVDGMTMPCIEVDGEWQPVSQFQVSPVQVDASTDICLCKYSNEKWRPIS